VDITCADEIAPIIRLLARMAAGIVAGWERTLKQRKAGIRTFGLVGLGTATAAIFAEPGQDDAQDDAASRVVQGILTGIGFLGAGDITLSRDERVPLRLTTAAAIRVTAAPGGAPGRGDTTIMLTAIALARVLLAVHHSIERWAARSTRRSGRDMAAVRQADWRRASFRRGCERLACGAARALGLLRHPAGRSRQAGAAPSRSAGHA
jgi:putative Mg2+ transporter-C (MgtC) family protein